MKVNYNDLMEKEISTLQSKILQRKLIQSEFHQSEDFSECENSQTENSKVARPKLLLHACCGPCSSACIERLCNVFEVTIYFYNPNIHPKTEHDRRLDELKRFVTEFPPAIKANVSVVEENEYNPKEFFNATNVENEPELKTEREMGVRCGRCYEFRMRKAWNYAKENGFEYFTTTLSISPHKDSKKINEIGEKLMKESENWKDGSLNTFAGNENSIQNGFGLEKNSQVPSKNLKFLYSDFKKKGGFLRSLQLSDEYGLYRQDYCGCVFSFRDGTNEENKDSSQNFETATN